MNSTEEPTLPVPSPRCGYTIVDSDGQEQPCDRPATGWRWYQDVEHEDTLDVACSFHENEGGRRMAEVERLSAELADARAEFGRYRAEAMDFVRRADQNEGQRARAVAAERALEAVRAAVVDTLDSVRAMHPPKTVDRKLASLRHWVAALSAASPTTSDDEPGTKPAALLLREIAERDPEAHAAALGRGYGIDRDPAHYPPTTSDDERRAMEADAIQEPSPSAMLAGIHITKYQPQDCECRGKHEHRFGYTADCTVRNCTCDGQPAASDKPARNPCTCDRAAEGAAFHHPTCPSYIGDEPARCTCDGGAYIDKPADWRPFIANPTCLTHGTASDGPARCPHGQVRTHWIEDGMPGPMMPFRACPGPAASGTPETTL